MQPGETDTADVAVGELVGTVGQSLLQRDERVATILEYVE